MRASLRTAFPRLLTSLLLSFVCSLPLPVFAQLNSVTINKQPATPPITTLTYYTSTGNPQYVCKAMTLQLLYTWNVTAVFGNGTLTNVVVLTNVGTVTTGANHGLVVNDVVTLSGSTTSTALNGTYVIQTVPSATTFTITTSGVSNATYSDATMKMTTTAARTNANIWSIEQFTYGSSGGASGNPIADQWAVNLGSPNNGGNVSMTFSCDNKALYGYQ